ncbi:MAG: hypothetical protein RLZZ60_1028 [Bacteroidota bacterium]|jgi:hypothetical protein
MKTTKFEILIYNKINKKLIALIYTIVFSNFQYAQSIKENINCKTSPTSSAIKSIEFQALYLGEIIPKSTNLKWKPIIINKCIKHGAPEEEEISKIRASYPKKIKFDSSKNEALVNVTTTNDAVVARNFIGNLNSGTTPMDNSIAISNNGNIISVANSTIEFYDSDGRLIFSNSIEAFFNDPNIINTCDPLVIYDSGSDKFIFFAQECSGSTDNTFLLVCFSESNDPTGKWHKYKLNGNPAGNNTWFDYPKIALSNNELYITGNSFTDNGPFKEALLYQIEKNNGFNGGNIKWQYWHNISGNPSTLLPVSNGHLGNYGPGCYLVSTKSGGSDKIEFYDLTNDMSASDEQLNHYTINTTAYKPSAKGYQKNSTIELDNGDCRAMSGFYLNGTLHFVFHSEYSNGYQGINYNRIDVSNLSITSKLFGLENYEYSYPSVASFSTDKNDKSVLIGFLRGGSSIYPEFRVVKCNDDMTWNGSILVKDGEDYCQIIGSSSEPERWGDYTGISRKHNSQTPCVWVNGMFGNSNNKWDTWIGEITEQNNTNLIVPEKQSIIAFPNPVQKTFNLEFETSSNETIIIELFDQSGKLVIQLFNDIVHPGKNHFQFNTTSLANGTYTLLFSANKKILRNEKIIISN